MIRAEDMEMEGNTQARGAVSLDCLDSLGHPVAFRRRNPDLVGRVPGQAVVEAAWEDKFLLRGAARFPAHSHR